MKSKLKTIQILHDELIRNGYEFPVVKSTSDLIEFKKENKHIALGAKQCYFFQVVVREIESYVENLTSIKYNSHQSTNRILELAGCERET